MGVKVNDSGGVESRHAQFMAKILDQRARTPNRVVNCSLSSARPRVTSLFEAMDEIPREVLIDMLKEACWYSGGRFKERGITDGFSLSVDEETCYRDVLIRRYELHPTQEAAIIAHWKEYYAG